MKIIIKNDIVVEQPNYKILSYCEQYLTLDNPDYFIAERLGHYVGHMPKHLALYVSKGDKVILPFGCLSDIWTLSKGAEYDNQISQWKGSNLKGNIDLYDYQEKALNALLGGKNGILEAPCGSGKTQIGLQLIKKLGGKALWLIHTRKLLIQSLERAKQYFSGDFGIITDGKVSIGKDITFATIQTMSKIDIEQYKNDFDIVVVDECHHCVGTPTKVMQFYKVLTNLNCRYKYGLSATLSRADNLINSVYAILGKKLYTITKEQVGDKIIKASHVKVDIDIEYNMLDYCDPDGTINYNNLINTLSFSRERNERIVKEIMLFNDAGKNQLILCHRVGQAEQIYHMLIEQGIESVSKVVGNVSEKKRDFDTQIIVATYALAREGLDIPKLDVLHLATPSKNEAVVRQSVGRVERNYQGKDQPVVIDYVDIYIDYCLNAFKKRKNYIKKNK